MSKLIVIGYEAPAQAEGARAELLEMSGEHLTDFADDVVAATDQTGRIKLNQMMSTRTIGASGGALTNYGINNDFMKKVASILRPGQGALFIMARQTSSDRVLERVGKRGGRIIRTNLDSSQEQRVRNAFDSARSDAVDVEPV